MKSLPYLVSYSYNLNEEFKHFSQIVICLEIVQIFASIIEKLPEGYTNLRIDSVLIEKELLEKLLKVYDV